MRKIMAFEESDIKMLSFFTALMCGIGLLTTIAAVRKAISPDYLDWVLVAYPLAALPAAIAQLAMACLRWVYGYAKSIGGATAWRKLDTVCVVIWAVAGLLALFCIVNLVFEPVTTMVPFGVLLTVSVVAVVGVAAIVNLSLKVRKDYLDWKKVEFHGIFAWDFQKFVEERFKAAAEKRPMIF